jgi:hypothetical protein
MIRSATHRDLPRCSDFLHNFWDQLKARLNLPEKDKSADITNFLLTALVDRRSCVLVDETVSGVLVGAITENPLWNLRTSVELAWYIETESRNLSLANSFIRAFEDWSRLKKASFVLLGSTPLEKSPKNLYKRQGYQPFEATYIKRLTW